MSKQLRKVIEIIEPQPVLEGAGVRLKRSIATRTLDNIDPFLLFDHFGSKDPADYVRRRFANAYADYQRDDDFEEWAVPVMKDTFQLPTFVTVCTKLAHNDTPMRIDMPAFSVGLPTRLSQVSASRMLDPPPKRVLSILQTLLGEYGGPELYNVFLVHADREARLPIKDVTTLYEPLIEKELKISLIPRRRERRLRYG